jgi:hypothetical protein
MKPNFDSALDLDNDNTRVDAAGPLDWEGTQGQCRVAVTITQTIDGTTITATGESGDYGSDKLRWEADANTEDGQAFQPGEAHAEGVLTLRHSSAPPVVWGQDVVLQEKNGG